MLLRAGIPCFLLLVLLFPLSGVHSTPPEKEKKITFFLHFPKTGSTTLRQHLKKMAKNHKKKLLLTPFYTRHWYHFLEKHGKYPVENYPDILSGEAFYGMHAYFNAPYEYITVFRHPVDRVVSRYNHLKKRKYLPPDMTLETFMRQRMLEDITVLESDNSMTRRVTGVNNSVDIGKMTEAHRKEALAILEKDFVLTGTLEEMEKFLFLLEQRFGWNLYYPLRANVTKEKHTFLNRDTLTDDQRTLIEAYNRHDLALYDYAHKRMHADFDALPEKEKTRFYCKLRSYPQMKERVKSRYTEALAAHCPNAVF